jgi:transglutaminase-like putative cysteine protease
MSMQLRIVHSTVFEYDGTATASYNQARMTPRTSAEQIVLHSRLDVWPPPWTQTYRDYFGTQVTAFEVLDPHESLTVTATSTVQTNRLPAPEPQLSWSDLATPEVVDSKTEYLRTSQMVAPPADLVERALDLKGEVESPSEAARAMCALVYDEVAYITGSTSVMTRAADAWVQRAGVCQDMAHLVIGGLRAMGIPARYVSGYQHPAGDPLIGEAVSGESHAWVEWWDDGWRGWDVANALEPLDQHVVVAAGRDYTDVRPLSGIYTGAATSAMSVGVKITFLG